MRTTLVLVIAAALALTGCGTAPRAAEPSALTIEITPALTQTPVQLPTGTPVPPTSTPAPPTSTPAPVTPSAPPTTALPEPTAVPTAAGTPTPPLFLEPTASGGATAAPTAATAAPTAAPAGAAATARPAAARQPSPSGRPVRLVIEGIDLDRALEPVGLDSNRMPIVLRHDIGWYTSSAQPGQGENVVLWGHVLRFKSEPNIPAPFARLKELKPGSHITLYDAQGASYRYVVSEQVWVTPDQVEYMLPRGREQVTMISCIGDKVIEEGSVEMTHRLITIAVPES